MPGYSDRALPFLTVLADGIFASAQVRNWLIAGTHAELEFANSQALLDEQRNKRWALRTTKQPFWANYHCGFDSKCTCRIAGSKSLETDAIFFLRNGQRRVLALHVEFKHAGEPFLAGQAEGYPLRAKCFAATHHLRKAMNEHHAWLTVLLCGREALGDAGSSHFQRVITHGDAAKMLAAYPGMEC